MSYTSDEQTQLAQLAEAYRSMYRGMLDQDTDLLDDLLDAEYTLTHRPTAMTITGDSPGSRPSTTPTTQDVVRPLASRVTGGRRTSLTRRRGAYDACTQDFAIRADRALRNWSWARSGLARSRSGRPVSNRADHQWP